jgi:hypothetical protein
MAAIWVSMPGYPALAEYRSGMRPQSRWVKRCWLPDRFLVDHQPGRGSQRGKDLSNRVGSGVAPPPPTPPDMRARIRRFVKPLG